MPLDEEQVERAVAFLLHPSVRGSGEEAKRSFLAKKGLDDEAIREAFRRAESATASSSNPPTDSSTAAQVHGTPPVTTAVPGYSYTSILLGVGFAAAAAYSLKTIFGPSISRTMDSIKTAMFPHAPSDGGPDDTGGSTDAGHGQGTDARVVTIVEIDDDAEAVAVCETDRTGRGWK